MSLNSFLAPGEPRSFVFARILVLLIVVAMTRAFALVSVLELLLWCLVVFLPTLRVAVVNTFRVPAIQLVGAFWVWLLLSTLWSDAAWSDRFEEVWSWRKLTLIPIAFAVFHQNNVKQHFAVLIVVVASCYMIVSWLGYFGMISLDREPIHLLENHTTQGIFFSFATFILVVFIRDGVISNRLLKIFALMLIVGFFCNVFFMSTGRSGHLFFVVGASYLTFSSFARYRLIALVVIGLALATTLVLSDTSRGRFLEALENFQTVDSPDAEYSSLGIRAVMWRTTAEMIQGKPLLGAGSGAFAIEYGRLVESEVGWRRQVADDPHQQYMHIAAEHGLIGLGLFLLILVAFGANLSQQNRLAKDLGFVMLLGIGATSLANGHFNTFVEGRLVWMSLAVFGAYRLSLDGFGGRWKKGVANKVLPN